jgi:hypothetical protein
MTTSKIVLLSLTFMLINKALFSQPSEHTSLSIVLQTDKKKYYPFEPILLTTEFKNISKANQWYYEPQILGTPVQYKIYYKRKEIHPYSQFDEVMGKGGGMLIGEDTAIEPDSSKRLSEIISKYFDLSKKYGAIKIEVGYPIRGEINGQWGYTVGHKTASITIKLEKEPAQETIPVQLFSEAISRLLGRNGYDNKVKENLEKIVNEHPNSYLIDQAYYFLSYYYYQAYSNEHKPEQLEAAKKYLSEFLQRFPRSVYLEEAKGLGQMINGL